ncbi:ABC transporter permease [Methanosarcina horonobensis]|nr:ABC transporter permease [Methanosarcina horonobensis]
MIEGPLRAILIGVILGVVPAYRVSKLKLVNALRYEETDKWKKRKGATPF